MVVVQVMVTQMLKLILNLDIQLIHIMKLQIELVDLVTDLLLSILLSMVLHTILMVVIEVL